MKKKYIYRALLLLLAMLSLQSCLKEQEDIFNDAAPSRIQKALDATQTVLMDSKYGWEMDYYPDRNQQYGGYVFTMQFDNLNVSASSELDTTATASSKYLMSDEAGPVLAFDTYNSVFHFFATPDINRYEGYDGDFEFIIDHTSADTVQVRGLRTNNVMYLYKLTKSPELYLRETMAMQNSMQSGKKVGGFEGDVDGRRVKAFFNYDSRQVSYTLSGDTTATGTTAYIYTDKGLRLYHAIPMPGADLTELFYDADAWNFTAHFGRGAGAATSKMSALHPAGYIEYGDIPGKWTLDTNELGKVDVTIEKDAKGTGFLMKGLLGIDVKLDYDSQNGKLYWHAQDLGTDANGISFSMYVLDGDGFYTDGWRNSMMTETMAENPITLHWISGDDYSRWEYLSYVGFRVVATDAAGHSSAAQENPLDISGATDYLFGGDSQTIHPKTLTKKN